MGTSRYMTDWLRRWDIDGLRCCRERGPRWLSKQRSDKVERLLSTKMFLVMTLCDRNGFNVYILVCSVLVPLFGLYWKGP